jgi:hypothetical protein
VDRAAVCISGRMAVNMRIGAAAAFLCFAGNQGRKVHEYGCFDVWKEANACKYITQMLN